MAIVTAAMAPHNVGPSEAGVIRRVLTAPTVLNADTLEFSFTEFAGQRFIPTLIAARVFDTGAAGARVVTPVAATFVLTSYTESTGRIIFTNGTGATLSRLVVFLEFAASVPTPT